MSTINLRKFDPNVLTKRIGFTSVVIGSPASGKTFLVEQDLLPRIKHNAFIISQTQIESPNSDEEQMRIYRINHPITLRDLDFVRYQRNRSVPEPISIILEDIQSTAIRNNDTQFLFMNGHTCRINLFLIYPDLPPNLRANTDFVFLLHTSSPHIQRKLYQQYGGMFPTFEQFQQVFVEATRKIGGCIVINQTSLSSRLEDKVFYYKSIKSQPLIRAVGIFERLWLRILAIRRLIRLKIGKEIEYLPNIGIKYFEAMNNFNLIKNSA